MKTKQFKRFLGLVNNNPTWGDPVDLAADASNVDYTKGNSIVSVQDELDDLNEAIVPDYTFDTIAEMNAAIQAGTVEVGATIFVKENSGGSGGGHTIVDSSGTDMTQRDKLKFVGLNVTDDSTNGQTIVTSPTMIGATASTTGASGDVPTPAAGDQDKYLKGDGSWANPANQNNDTANSDLRLLLSNSANDNNEATGISKKSGSFTANPSTGKLTVPIAMLTASLLPTENSGKAASTSWVTDRIYKDQNGKNLLPNETGKALTHNGITYTPNEDGSITANGIATGGTSLYRLYTGKYDNAPFLNKTLTLSGANNEVRIMAYRVGSVDGSSGTYGSGDTFTWLNDGTSNTPGAIDVYVNEGVTVNNVTIYPMLRLASDTDSTFVPYAMTNQRLTKTAETVYGSSDAYSERAYSLGEYCIHDNAIYECSTPCSAGSWATNASCFTKTTITKVLNRINSTVNDKLFGKIHNISVNPGTITANKWSVIGVCTVNKIAGETIVCIFNLYLRYSSGRPTGLAVSYSSSDTPTQNNTIAFTESDTDEPIINMIYYSNSDRIYQTSLTFYIWGKWNQNNPTVNLAGNKIITI